MSARFLSQKMIRRFIDIYKAIPFCPVGVQNNRSLLDPAQKVWECWICGKIHVGLENAQNCNCKSNIETSRSHNVEKHANEKTH